MQKKRVLLIEPNYKNKFPPIAIMKLSTYYKNLGGWEVTFFKGKLKHLVAELVVDKLIFELKKHKPKTNWNYKKKKLLDFVLAKNSDLENITDDIFIQEKILAAKKYYKKNEWQTDISFKFDRVGVTTLFTFYWDITIATIKFAKLLVKDKNDLMVGGVLASIQPEEIFKATGIKPFVGLLDKPGILDPGDTQIIDELELDYSILDQIDYKYKMTSAYYYYTTRGCIRRCPFCAVPKIEPKFNSYISIKEKIASVNKKYGEQKDLLLMDNNVLASKDFDKIIDDIKASGFFNGAKFKEQNTLEHTIKNLVMNKTSKELIRKAFNLIYDFYFKLKSEESFQVYKALSNNNLDYIENATYENIIITYNEIKDLYNEKFSTRFKNSRGRLRYVDFNQGLDARLFTPHIAKRLTEIAINPVRIAFDSLEEKEQYVKAITMCADVGLKNFSNYLLYNFNDKPEYLYERLKINIELCEKLDVNIYSFPMKFHPIKNEKSWTEDFSHNRNYLGKHWNKKYIRAIQAILNARKGKVGRGKDFFYKAFGKDLNEFFEILEMPESYIIYRFFFEWLGSNESKTIISKLSKSEKFFAKQFSKVAWKNTFLECKNILSEIEFNNLLDLIHKNDFSDIKNINKTIVRKLLSFYNPNLRNINKIPELRNLKAIFDSLN